MRESELQSRIIKYLEANGWFVVKLIQTNKNGIPDLMALKGGRIKFIEVKSETGKVSELQSYRIDQLKKQGFEAIIANNLNQITL